MIVGTAGHIDHGKTALLQALTGVAGDRRREERERGITIDLGYSYADLGNGEPTGFIDVPGHERFVHNMLAGAGGIDCALLVVAADDGVMPQTREHLAIVTLLGIPRALVALTKIDRVDAARLAAADAEVAALLADGPYAGAPRFAVSSVSGAGVDALRAADGVGPDGIESPRLSIHEYDNKSPSGSDPVPFSEIHSAPLRSTSVAV